MAINKSGNLRSAELEARELEDLTKKLETGNLAEIQQVKEANIKKNANLERTEARKTAAEIAATEKKRKKEEAKATRDLQKQISKMNLEEYTKFKAMIGEEVDKSKEEIEKELKKLQRKETGTQIAEALFGSAAKWKEDFDPEKILKQGIEALGKAMTSSIDNAIDVYTKYQTAVSTRLIGTNKDFSSITASALQSSPLYKSTAYIENVNRLVEEGIAQNVEQRAFLATIKDELVTTFDATNSTLERLVRIQNADSTAARMGMEGYLNQFLNDTFQNTEYLTDVFDGVTSYLEEASALMSSNDAVSFEYAVQKWLGSLYSVGMSSSGINTIAQALGQLGTGNINSLIGTGSGNLLAMVTNGNLADYLKDGLTQAAIDTIMQDMVTYLTELNGSGNNVVRSQLANVFGLTISDLQAAANLNTSSIYSSILTAEGANSYLNDLMSTAGSRVSTAVQMQNFMDNLSFAFGRNIADSQLLTGVWTGSKIADSLGIDAVSDLANIAKVATMGVGSLKFAKSLLWGETNLINNLASVYGKLGGIVTSGTGLVSSGTGYSESAFVGNKATSEDYKNSLTKFKENEAKEIQALQQETYDEDDLEVVVPNIYKYLRDEFDGKVDTLIKLASIGTNYSVIDTYGNNMTNAMATIMGGTSVVVSANETNKNAEYIDTIQSSVVGIYDLLNKVTTGELQFTIKDVGSVSSMVSGAVATQFGYVLGQI